MSHSSPAVQFNAPLGIALSQAQTDLITELRTTLIRQSHTLTSSIDDADIALTIGKRSETELSIQIRLVNHPDSYRLCIDFEPKRRLYNLDDAKTEINRIINGKKSLSDKLLALINRLHHR